MNTELSLDKIPCVCVYLSETKCMKRRKSTYVTCTFEWTLFVLSIVSLNHFIVNELCRTDLLVVTRFSQFKPYEASVKPVKSQKKEQIKSFMQLHFHLSLQIKYLYTFALNKEIKLAFVENWVGTFHAKLNFFVDTCSSMEEYIKSMWFLTQREKNCWNSFNS